MAMTDTPASPAVELRGIGKSFGDFDALKNIDLSVARGSFVAIVGPSGCGKSTLLRVIAGLETSTNGQILIDGADVTDAPPAERGLAMVFQSYALYPHKTVRQNMGFSLKIARHPKADIEAKVAEASRALQLDALLDRYPRDLSGGQRQRVAIGRAIVREPKAFLFDEPLSNLDAALRTETRVELAELHQRLGTTTIYVTHDQVEAMTLADKIVILKAGEIQQVGTPKRLYAEPANEFVAGFIGSPKMNLFPGKVHGRRFTSPNIDLDLASNHTPTDATLGIRPEHLAMTQAGDRFAEFTVDFVEYLGDESVVHGHISDGTPMKLRRGGEVTLEKGAVVGLAPPEPSHVHLFSRTDGVRLAGDEA